MSACTLPSPRRELLPWAVFGFLMFVLAAAGPLGLPAHYHVFADTRSLWGVPNACDVLSNLGFLGVGLWGLRVVWRLPASAARAGWAVFAASVALTALGSGWYHLAPDDLRIDWDRLPIAMACAGLVGAVVVERLALARRHAATVLMGLLAYAALAVFCVPWLAAHGVGDLRLYILLQLGPLVLVPLLQWAYRAPRTERAAFLLATGAYVLAKFSELGDHAIFAALGGVSGHTLKHLLATLACGLIVGALARRVRPQAQAVNWMKAAKRMKAGGSRE